MCVISIYTCRYYANIAFKNLEPVVAPSWSQYSKGKVFLSVLVLLHMVLHMGMSKSELENHPCWDVT